MRFMLPILLTLALAVVLWHHHRQSAADERWRLHQSAMSEMKRFIKEGAIIGCPVDSNHTRDFYECRYWLATAILRANAPALDTQLVITLHDGRPARQSYPIAGYTVIHTIHTEKADYSLAKKSP